MVKKKYIAPNLITAGNMFLGYLSMTESIKGRYDMAIWFIILAMVCDGLDGKTARKLDAFSEFGKEFDSFFHSSFCLFSLYKNTNYYTKFLTIFRP